MLRKIYQELVAIRKELQDIRKILEPRELDCTIGGKYIGNTTHQTTDPNGVQSYVGTYPGSWCESPTSH